MIYKTILFIKTEQAVSNLNDESSNAQKKHSRLLLRNKNLNSNSRIPIVFSIENTVPPLQSSKKLYSLNIEIIPQKNGNTPRVNQHSSNGVLPTDISISDLVQNINIYNYDTQQRQVYNAPDIKHSMPESSKPNPIYPNMNAILNHKQNVVEKGC